MAIAPFDRDPVRLGGTSESRFKLLQEVCRCGDAAYWRAVDRRGGRNCVVRVFETNSADTSRRLGELHRERVLAERLARPEVLRTDVPLIEGERIFQLVEPEPAHTIDAAGESGRLAIIMLLVNVARVLAGAHALGVFHGAFSRASCLRTADGRLLVQGFTGDAAVAAAVRDGIAADHRAFLEFAQKLLQGSGGPPPRLRRYFQRELAPSAPRPAANALATLADELRESLEDTFPWPAAGAHVVPPAPPRTESAVECAAPTPNPKPARVRASRQVSRGRASPAAAVAPAVSTASSPVPAVMPQAPAAHFTPAALTPRVTPASAAVAAVMPASAAAPASVPTPVTSPSPAVAPTSPPATPADAPPDRDDPDGASTTEADGSGPTRPGMRPAAAEIWYPPAAPRCNAVAEADEARSRRPLWPWLVALLLGTALAVWHFGTRADPRPPPPPPRAAASMQPESPVTATAREDGAASAGPVVLSGRAGVTVDPARATGEGGAAAAAAVMTRSGGRAIDRPAIESRPRPAPESTVRAATDRPLQGSVESSQEPVAMEAQSARSRVAPLVAGGNRALTALEPEMAREAFAAALALAPNDRAALEGSQRARRLAGVAALMRDAREAAARGDHARAVQGYAQALRADPRNRGLGEALAVARRSLARDAVGSVLAEGHAALGAGRLEAARDAFARALALDASAPGARLGAEQAATAIALRDQSSARRVVPTDAGPTDASL